MNKKILLFLLIFITVLLIPQSYVVFANIIKQENLLDGTMCYYVNSQEENVLALSIIEARMDTKARIVYSKNMIFSNTMDYYFKLFDTIYHPQYNVYDTQYGIGSLTGCSPLIYKKAKDKIIVDYNLTYFETSEQIRYVSDTINNAIKSNISNLKTDYDKTKWAYQWIIDNVQYDKDCNHYTAYDGLQSTGTVCQGYATLYSIIANKLGLNCEIVMGGVNGSETNHVWNIIKLNSKWYCVDATWGDVGEKYDKYFLKSMNSFSSANYGYHKSTLYDNYVKAGEIFSDTDYDNTIISEIHPVMPSIFNIKMDVLKNNALSVNEKYRFLINNSDNVKINYRNTNTNVAKVTKNGEIIGLKKGNTTITAYNNQLNFAQSCIITVK